jgi:SHS2 domain-containing protein
VRHEELEHTADVGIRAFGANADELFAAAAEGMFSLIADLSKVKPKGEVEVRVSGPGLDRLFVNWLSELLVLHETQDVLLRRFEVHVAGDRADGRAWGERIDKRRHRLKLAVKAVTSHRLRVDPAAGIAEVIFDV